MISGLYSGTVLHVRTRPRRHRLAYRVFMLLADLDELEDLDRGLRLFSSRGWSLVGLRTRDHGDGSGRPLKAQLEAELAAAGLPHGGPVRMLAFPRIFGLGFDPLTVFFCHAADGALAAILYEVNNTFGERHSYLIPVSGGGLVRQACDKDFYVSPFMDMGLAYDFCVRPPGDTVGVAIDVHDDAGVVLAASFHGDRRPLTDRGLLRAWLTHPWMTLGVLAAIHVEALKIWLKGEPIRRRPPPPARRVTVVGAAAA
jgi:DUF1365 family protein